MFVKPKVECVQDTYHQLVAGKDGARAGQHPEGLKATLSCSSSQNTLRNASVCCRGQLQHSTVSCLKTSLYLDGLQNIPKSFKQQKIN